MNIETANRLYELRKKNNLSQEDVADKLGISRQSVSKWERAEASPDTDNLISLAKLYNVSLDELLNAEKSNEFVEENKTEEIVPEVVVEEKENDEADTIVESTEKKQGLIGSIISSSIALVVVITYLLLGFLVNDAWYHFWPLFFLIPVVPSFVGTIALKKFTVFAYPVFVTMLFCFFGVFLDLWHPMWILFVTIPVYYIIAESIDKAIEKKRQ